MNFKFLLFFYFAFFLICNPVSGQQRVTLVEQLTSANCLNCKSTNGIVGNELSSMENVIIVKYHMHVGGVDPMAADFPYGYTRHSAYTSQCNFRNGVPAAAVNGTSICGLSPGNFITKDAITEQNKIPSDWKMNLSYQFDASKTKVNITLNITSLKAQSQNTYRAYILLLEEEINYETAPGSNGEKDFYHVARALNMEDLKKDWTAGESYSITKTMNVPTFFKKIAQLSVVAFIQDQTSLKVGQAAYAGRKEELATKVANVSLSLPSVTLYPNIPGMEWVKITHAISPVDATNRKVTWSSSNDSIAYPRVYSTGSVYLTAVKPGKATITVTTEDGNRKSNCLVTSEIGLEKMSLNKKAISMNVGGHETLTSTLTPANADNKKIVWSSSDERVATVNSEGVITAVATGTASITASAASGTIATEKCPICKVTVNKAPVSSIEKISSDPFNVVLSENELKVKYDLSFHSSEHVRADLYDITGNVLKSANLQNQQGELILNVSDFPVGTYILRITSENEVLLVRKLMLGKK